MKFGGFIAFLFLIYETSFYLVTGKTTDKSDCTKLYNFIKNDTEDYSNSCCSDPAIFCDEDGHITFITK